MSSVDFVLILLSAKILAASANGTRKQRYSHRYHGRKRSPERPRKQKRSTQMGRLTGIYSRIYSKERATRKRFVGSRRAHRTVASIRYQPAAYGEHAVH